MTKNASSRKTVTFKKVADTGANDLLEQSNLYMAELYPSESNHLIDLSELLAPQNLFIGAWLDNQIVGCIALIAQEGYGEIKRLFVDPKCRGQQVGAKLLQEIEKHAKQRCLPKLCLETGIHQTASISLYEKADYQRISPFGDYQPDPLSLFMEKEFQDIA